MLQTVSFVIVLLLFFIIDNITGIAFGQQPVVHLRQGSLIGILVYTSERRQINAYLGIPYAKAPIGELRFAYVNYKKWPVVVFVEGEEFATGSGNRFGGQDLADQDGIVVVTINYRLNVFGFLCFGDSISRGNLGLLDQYMALLWVKENIASFGGDPYAVTWMGHSAGAASGLLHLTSPRTRGLFHRMILMSGAVTSPWMRVQNPVPTSRAIARSLGCFEKNTKELLRCLRTKNTIELINAFQEHHNNGNWTDLVGPVIDSFLPPNDQYLLKDPEEVLESGQYNHIPILTGITNNEGGIVLFHWRDLIRESYNNLLRFFYESAIPLILLRYGYNNSVDTYIEYEELIKWRYLYGINEGDSSKLLNRLVQLFSDAQFNAPHARQLSLITSSPNPVPIYTYRFDQSYGPNLYGTNLPMPGSIHGSELLYLFGVSRLIDNRFNQPQAQLAKQMRRLWTNFIKYGNPTPMNDTHGRFWAPYTTVHQETFHLRSDLSTNSGGDFNEDPQTVAERVSLWNDLLPHLMKIHLNRTHIYVSPELSEFNDTNRPLRSAVFALVGIVSLLVIVLLICLWLLRRRSRQLDHAELF